MTDASSSISIVGDLLTALCTVVLGGIALFKEEFRDYIEKKEVKESDEIRRLYFASRLRYYEGGIIDALTAISRILENPRISHTPVRIPFPPTVERYLGVDFIRRERVHARLLAEYESCNLELEGVLERNHASLVLSLRPGGGEAAEAELSHTSTSGLEIIKARLEEALDIVKMLIQIFEDKGFSQSELDAIQSERKNWLRVRQNPAQI
jgi:hypothetical protein